MSVDLLTRAETNLILPTLLREAPAKIVEDVIAREVELVLNTETEWQSSRESLVVNVGMQRSHPLLLDLVSAGPHAVITGMTGSGKTEFIKSWLVALVASYPPDELSFLVIDFKGGAGFAQFQSLAHVVGVVTDLDHAEARRAMTSLQAEIRYRERALAQAQVGDISLLSEDENLSRLVVIVDEYRAVLEAFPELVNVFIDIAARGRSLGIHLILSSQRVGGTLGDALLANCALRVGFRVSQKQDSHALLGNDACFALPHIPGRAVLMGTGMDQREFQAARLRPDDIEVVEAKTEQWQHEKPGWSARVPWLPKLAANIYPDDMPQPLHGMSWLGLADIPEHQVQTWMPYSAHQDGNLLVTGPSRSGISNACHLIAQQYGVEVIADAEVAWDVVVETTAPERNVLVIDGLDAILDEFDLEHRETFLQCLTRLARHAPQTGNAVILGCSDHIRGQSALLALFPLTLTLFSHSQPGHALWNGHEVQLVHTQQMKSPVVESPRLVFEQTSSYIVITQRRQLFLNQLLPEAASRVCNLGDELNVTSMGENTLYLGTPDEWMSRLAQLSTLRGNSVLILDGCSTSELRSLRIRPGLFPHLGYGKTLVVEPDGSTTRVIL
jgi:S-DNA-T family DNA segregation ATPase FtsK/SpoIIIE